MKDNIIPMPERRRQIDIDIVEYAAIMDQDVRMQRWTWWAYAILICLTAALIPLIMAQLSLRWRF